MIAHEFDRSWSLICWSLMISAGWDLPHERSSGTSHDQRSLITVYRYEQIDHDPWFLIAHGALAADGHCSWSLINTWALIAHDRSLITDRRSEKRKTTNEKKEITKKCRRKRRENLLSFRWFDCMVSQFHQGYRQGQISRNPNHPSPSPSPSPSPQEKRREDIIRGKDTPMVAATG